LGLGGRANRSEETMTLQREKRSTDGQETMSSRDYDVLETRESPVRKELEFLVVWAAQVLGVIV